MTTAAERRKLWLVGSVGKPMQDRMQGDSGRQEVWELGSYGNCALFIRKGGTGEKQRGTGVKDHGRIGSCLPNVTPLDT